MVLNHIAIHQEKIKKGFLFIYLLFHILPRSIKILENLKELNRKFKYLPTEFQM